MDKIKEFFEDVLNDLRNISYRNSTERAEFATVRLLHHREHMDGKRRWNPYIDEDEWNKQM